jgi:DNA-binding response OmpR family regulator
MHVLIADDHEYMRLILREVLREAGHEVDAVADGEAAWAAWERARPPLVLLDWQMPGLDGVEVTRRIRAAEQGRPGCFVIVVTAHDPGDGLATVLDAGADDYLTKPVTPNELRARLAIAVRRIAQEEARRAAEEALARARWLAGIGETTLALQHEINNPLAALLGNTALIEARIIQPDEYEETVAVIAEQARRIAAVVKRLATLRDPQSVEYHAGARMLDLSGEDGAGEPP